MKSRILVNHSLEAYKGNAFAGVRLMGKVCSKLNIVLTKREWIIF